MDSIEKLLAQHYGFTLPFLAKSLVGKTYLLTANQCCKELSGIAGQLDFEKEMCKKCTFPTLMGLCQ